MRHPNDEIKRQLSTRETKSSEKRYKLEKKFKKSNWALSLHRGHLKTRERVRLTRKCSVGPHRANSESAMGSNAVILKQIPLCHLELSMWTI